MVCGTGAIGEWGWLDRPLGLVNFGPACQMHDDRYRSPLGNSRRWIDSAFLADMLRMCRFVSRWQRPYWFLSLFAHLYYRVVRGSRGQAAWDKARRNDT